MSSLFDEDGQFLHYFLPSFDFLIMNDQIAKKGKSDDDWEAT